MAKFKNVGGRRVKVKKATGKRKAAARKRKGKKRSAATKMKIARSLKKVAKTGKTTKGFKKLKPRKH